MKTFLLAMMMIASSITSLFADQTSTLHLRLQNNSSFILVLDGNEFGPMGTDHTIRNINPGAHSLHVYTDLMGWGNQLVRTMISNEWINLSASSEVFALINYDGRFIIEKTIYGNNPGYVSNYYNQYTNYSYNNHQTGCTCRECSGHNSPCNTNYMIMSSPGYCAPMDHSSFEMLKSSVANQWFDSTKETVIKQALMSNHITVAQLAELLELLSFENTKLSVAKFSYNKIVDQQNFFIVNDCFWFSSSIDELYAIIGR